MSAPAAHPPAAAAIVKGTPKSASAVDHAVGQAARARRIALGISQEKLAQTLGVSFQQLQKYENGTNRISAGRLFDLAAALACRVGDLMPPETDLVEADTPAGRFTRSREFFDVAAVFDRVADPARRRKIVEVLDLLAPAEAV